MRWCKNGRYIIEQISMAINNQINRDCAIHKQICDYFCTSLKCQNKILCQKCIIDHLEVHPRQFIYNLENISEIHAFDKVTKMKEVLGKQKIVNEERVNKMYKCFEGILDPITEKVDQFKKQSKQMAVKELFDYLAKNKAVIQNTKVTKSDRGVIKITPQKMVEETINEVEMINQREAEIKSNTENFVWYANAAEEMCNTVNTELTSMTKVAIRLIDNCLKIQSTRYTEGEIGKANHHQQSFYRRYTNSHEVANKGERNAAEMALMKSKKEMFRKDQQIKRAKNEIKQKVTNIEELHEKIEGLKYELLMWEQKLERQEKQRRQAAGRERKKLEQFLIKNDVISNDVNVITLQKKPLQDKYIALISELVPRPLELILSQNMLNKSQLQPFSKYKSLLIFRMSFISCDKDFLSNALKNYENLHTLELNSAGITDEALSTISYSFPNKLRHLYLIDNLINDDGLDHMFKNMRLLAPLESLFVSYNNLTSRGVEVINRYCFQVKTLHISKNPIKTKGAASIGKYLKDLEELFIGGTGVQKEGFLAICRNCAKLRRLSLVATEVTTDIVSQLLLGLQKLEWLDISYTGMNQADLAKVEKLKIFNKGVEIVAQM